LQKNESVKQRSFRKDLKALDACSLKSIDKVKLYEVYNHYLHYSVFVSSTRQEKQLCLQRCSFTIEMDLKLILHRTTTISGKRSLVIDQCVKRLLLMCWQFTTSLSHLFIKEWKLRDWYKDSTTIYKCQNSAEIVMHSKLT
jgi:hypothetical protein